MTWWHIINEVAIPTQVHIFTTKIMSSNVNNCFSVLSEINAKLKFIIEIECKQLLQVKLCC